MAVVSMKELLEAGVHFGHQTRRWNPKMKRFIFDERGGIYIIDLQQTQALLEEAYEFARNVAERGGTILFVGTKKQAQEAIVREATRVGQPYVAHRWLGGLLTNWRTIADRISYLQELRRLKEEGQLELLPAKERIAMAGELEKLEANLGGVSTMKRQPDAVFIVDLRKEQLALREAQRLGLPVIALVDTNCDPDEVTYVVPGNDDAIRSCSLVIRAIADGIAAGRTKVTEAELAPAPAQQDEAPSEESAAAPSEPQAMPMTTAFHREIDVDHYPFLRSHVMNERAVVPIAFLIEWLAHGAMHEHPGLVFAGIDDLKILKGLSLDPDQRLPVSVLAGSPAPTGALGSAGSSLQARVEVLCDTGAHRLQAALVVVLAVALLALPTLLVVLPWLSGLG